MVDNAPDTDTPQAARAEPDGRPLRRHSPLDVLLLLAALPRARAAQRVLEVDPRRLANDMAGGAWTLGAAPERVGAAAAAATARWARWFHGLDTSLTRSLVLGSMLAGRGETLLHIGFRPVDGDRPVNGHAWVTLDGRPVGPDAEQAEESFARVLDIPFARDEEAA